MGLFDYIFGAENKPRLCRKCRNIFSGYGNVCPRCGTFVPHSSSEQDPSSSQSDSEEDFTDDDSATQSDVPSEKYHASILGLRGRVTFTDIKRAYRQRMTEYHPDKVAALGPKLRDLAEAESKRINAAYEYFCERYGDNGNA